MIQEHVLADGRRVVVRPIRPTDLAIHTAFVASLSFQTGYMRLLSPRKPQADELKRMTTIDARREFALVATTATAGVEEEVGVARYVRGDSPQTAEQAEFAVVIADAWQRRGLAEMMLRRIVDAAAEAGVKRLSDIAMHDNLPMLSLARKLGFEVRRMVGDGSVMRISMDLEHPRA